METIENLSDLIRKFLQHLKVDRNLTDKTITAYGYDLSRFMEHCDHCNFHLLNNQSLSTYFQNLCTSGLKPSSIRRKIIVLNLFSKYALTIGHITKEDMPLRPKGKYILPKRLPKTIPQEHISAILAYAYKTVSNKKTRLSQAIAWRNVAILELLYCTGIRIGELSNINIGDYFQNASTLLIHGKGRKERILYISCPEVVSTLHTWIQHRDTIKSENDALFLNRYGGRLSIFGIEDVFSKFLSGANIPTHATPHCLRHSFATNLLANGANIRDVQEILGHSSIMTTQIYTEVNTERKRYVLTQYNSRNHMEISSTAS